MRDALVTSPACACSNPESLKPGRGKADAQDEFEYQDDFLDYDPEPYEQSLRDAWAKAGVRPWKPSAKELDDALCEARKLVERFNYFATR